MILKDFSFDTPQENIVYDEVLLHMAEQGCCGEVLRFWESHQLFIVLGRIGKEGDDLNLETVRRDHLPVLRRCSGGGTVVQGRGCLNYSLVLSKEADPAIADLRKSYQYILSKIIVALKQCGVEASFYPTSDIAIIGSHKKISGNAQKRSRKYILHHGTLLYDFDLDMIERYLQMPKDIPDYRCHRDHSEFVVNAEVDADQFKDAVKCIFGVSQNESVTDVEMDCLRSFLKEKNIFVDLKPCQEPS